MGIVVICDGRTQEEGNGIDREKEFAKHVERLVVDTGVVETRILRQRGLHPSFVRFKFSSSPALTVVQSEGNGHIGCRSTGFPVIPSSRCDVTMR